jgi:hypothetical protein
MQSGGKRARRLAAPRDARAESSSRRDSLTHRPSGFASLLSLHRNNDAHYCSTSSAISRIQQPQQHFFGESMTEPPAAGAAARPPTAAPHAQKPTATPCPCCKWCSAFIRSVGGQICRSLLPSEPRNVCTIFSRPPILRLQFWHYAGFAAQED